MLRTPPLQAYHHACVAVQSVLVDSGVLTLMLLHSPLFYVVVSSLVTIVQ